MSLYRFKSRREAGYGDLGAKLAGPYLYLVRCEVLITLRLAGAYGKSGNSTAPVSLSHVTY